MAGLSHVQAFALEARVTVATAPASALRGHRWAESLPQPPSSSSGTSLRKALVASDAVATTSAWTGTLLVTQTLDGAPLRLLATALVTLLTLQLISSFGLYRARVCAVRAVEVTRLAQVSVLSGAAMLLLTSWVDPTIHAGAILVGSGVAFTVLTVCRCVFASWLRARRLEGQYVRRLVIVGDNEEGVELEKLVRLQPELGFEVAGVATNPEQVRPLLKEYDANGVIVAASALGRREFNLLVRELLEHGVHVVVSNGLFGIDHDRIRAHPFAREPLYYVEPAGVSRTQFAAKRAVDIFGAALGLLLTLPVLVAAAVAIKMQDGGPIVFRHRRIGRHGKPFTLYKLRSMVPDAEKRLAPLEALNQRRDGPLFKADNDTRVTRVGRILRATSIDELPQLVNVLRGTMSLVGPRPALPSEVAHFDEEFLTRRQLVRPGVTGLWQVEARDNPSFHSYRRLDLFYIENFSLRLDIRILLDTFTAVMTGVMRVLLLKREAKAKLAAVGVAIGIENLPPMLPPADLPSPGFISSEGA